MTTYDSSFRKIILLEFFETFISNTCIMVFFLSMTYSQNNPVHNSLLKYHGEFLLRGWRITMSYPMWSLQNMDNPQSRDSSWPMYDTSGGGSYSLLSMHYKHCLLSCVACLDNRTLRPSILIIYPAETWVGWRGSWGWGYTSSLPVILASCGSYSCKGLLGDLHIYADTGNLKKLEMWCKRLSCPQMDEVWG